MKCKATVNSMMKRAIAISLLTGMILALSVTCTETTPGQERTREPQTCTDKIISCYSSVTCPYPGQTITMEKMGNPGCASEVIICVCKCPRQPLTSTSTEISTKE